MYLELSLGIPTIMNQVRVDPSGLKSMNTM